MCVIETFPNATGPCPSLNSCHPGPSVRMSATSRALGSLGGVELIVKMIPGQLMIIDDDDDDDDDDGDDGDDE